MNNPPLPPSVNFHLWQPCNMECRFCFAGFEDVRSSVLPRGHLPKEDALALTRILAQSFDKVTFVGGEPTLCPWLPELIGSAKAEGATTMIVSNGTRLTREYLASLSEVLDWVTLSIDSARAATNVELGRAVRGRPLGMEEYTAIAAEVRRLGMRLKVNTVVSALNVDEDLSELVAKLAPERWKLFQVLPVDGQNSGRVEPLLIDAVLFAAFVERHRSLAAFGIDVVAEDNDAMRGSYAMVDPAGRFFDNTDGGYRYGSPILRVGVSSAWDDVQFDLVRFIGRGGVYAWGR